MIKISFLPSDKCFFFYLRGHNLFGQIFHPWSEKNAFSTCRSHPTESGKNDSGFRQASISNINYKAPVLHMNLEYNLL